MPAISAIVEGLPPTARGQVLVEVGETPPASSTSKPRRTCGGPGCAATGRPQAARRG
uniref:hypothetical protein n=1 Tax=Saccharopolyspora pogona TaxID=333966 RepID=UPI001682E666